MSVALNFYYQHGPFRWLINIQEIQTLLLCIKRLGYHRNIGQCIAKYVYDFTPDVEALTHLQPIKYSALQHRIIACICDKLVNSDNLIVKTRGDRRAGKSFILSKVVPALALCKNHTVVEVICTSPYIMQQTVIMYVGTLWDIGLKEHDNFYITQSNADGIHLCLPEYDVLFMFNCNANRSFSPHYIIIEHAENIRQSTLQYILHKLECKQSKVLIMYCDEKRDFYDDGALSLLNAIFNLKTVDGSASWFNTVELT